MSYRQSHLERGTTYDQTLRQSPWDAYMARWEERHAVDIVRRLFPGKVPRYMDFACGTARITQSIAPLAKETVGVDVSPTMLHVARTKVPSAQFIEADLTKDAAVAGQFDLVTSFRFLGNAEQALRVLVLSALNKVLRSGGYLLINNHRNPLALASLFDAATGGERVLDLTHGKLQRVLADAGFVIVERRPIGVWKYRSKLMGAPASSAERDERLERRFGGDMWVPIAPDALVLAKKVRDVAA